VTPATFLASLVAGHALFAAVIMLRSVLRQVAGI